MLSFEGASVFRIQAVYGVLIRDIPFLPAQGKGGVGRGALGLTVPGFCLPCPQEDRSDLHFHVPCNGGEAGGGRGCLEG